MNRTLPPQTGVRTGLGGFLTPTRKRSEASGNTMPSPTMIKLGRTSVSAQRKDRPTVQSLLQQIRSPARTLKSPDKKRYAPPLVTKGPSVPAKRETGGSGLKVSGQSMPLKFKKAIVDFTRTPGVFTRFDLDNLTPSTKPQTLLGDSGPRLLSNTVPDDLASEDDDDDEDIPGFGKIGGVGREGFVNILCEEDDDEVYGAVESKLAELMDVHIDLAWIKSNLEDTMFVLGLAYNRVCFLNSFIKILDIFFHVVMNIRELSVILPLNELCPSPPQNNTTSTMPELRKISPQKVTPGTFITQLAAKNKGKSVWARQGSEGSSTSTKPVLSEPQKYLISKALYYYFKTAEENAHSSKIDFQELNIRMKVIHNYSFDFPAFCNNFERLVTRALYLSETFRMPLHQAFVRLFKMLENNAPLIDADDYLQLAGLYLNLANTTLEKQITAISKPVSRIKGAAVPPSIAWDATLDAMLKRQTIRTLIVKRSGNKLVRHFELLRDLLVICPVGNPVVVAYLYSALSCYTKYSQTLKLLQDRQQQNPSVQQIFQAVYLSLAEWAATQIPALPVLPQPTQRVQGLEIPESERNALAEAIGNAFENYQRHWQSLVLFEIGMCVRMDSLAAKETVLALQKLVKSATVRPDTDPCQLFLLCSRILSCLETYLGSLVVITGSMQSVKEYSDLAPSLLAQTKLIRAQGREEAPFCRQLLKQLASLAETLLTIQRCK